MTAATAETAERRSYCDYRRSVRDRTSFKGPRIRMKFIDLETQQKRIGTSLDRRIRQVLDHGQYINGPEVNELEEALAGYIGVKHAVGCASGTDALLMSLMAYGVGPGDIVFTTPFTFIATAEVISLLGAIPVFVDINPETFNLNPAELERAIHALETDDSSLHPLPSCRGSLPEGKRPLVPKGVIAVDLFGLPADYDAITTIAREHGLFLIEDAAQSFGAEYKSRKSCSLADVACTSFFPSKPLGCYGDGGMCFTNDEMLAHILRSLRMHGMGDDRYQNVRIGINGRLDTIQAAVLLAKFEIFSDEVRLRREAAAQYSRAFARGPSGPSGLAFQAIPPGRESIWAQYSILARDLQHRNLILKALIEAEIPSAVYYPIPLHLQQAFGWLGYAKGDFPVSEAHADRIFSIPIHPYLGGEAQQQIVETICSVCDF